MKFTNFKISHECIFPIDNIAHARSRKIFQIPDFVQFQSPSNRFLISEPVQPLVGVHHGVTVSFGSAKVCLPAIFEKCFSYDQDIWIAATDCYIALSIDSYSPINKFYNFIIFSFPVNTIILLLNCLVLLLYCYIHFLSHRCYFLYLNIFWTFI